MPVNGDFHASLLRRVDRYRAVEEKLRRRFDEVKRELEKAESRREAAETLYEAEFGAQPDERAKAATESTKSRSELAEAARRLPDGALTGLSWQDAINHVLAEGEPLHVREIWRRLADGGFKTRAQDPLRSIVAVVVRMPGVVRAGANTYAVVDGAARQRPAHGQEVSGN